MSLRILLLAGLSLATAAHATPPPPPAEPAAVPAAAEERLLSPQQRQQLQMHVMTGELAAGRNQPLIAAREFVRALELADDAELAQRATSLALAARDNDLAMKAARRWLALAPNEADPREVIARLALLRGDLDETYRQCEALVSGHAGGPGDGLRQVSQILSLAGEDRADAALTVLQRLTAQWPQSAEAHHALAMLALRYNRLPLADSAAQRALELAPQGRESLLLVAGVRVRQNRLDESDAIIEKLAVQDKNPSDLRLGYARLLLENAARDRARAQLNRLLQADRQNHDARYALGVLDANDRNFDAAERTFLSLLESPRQSEAAYQLGRIEESRRNYAKALGYFERVGNGPQSLDAAVRRANVLAQMGQIEPARKLMQDLRSDVPQLAERFYLAEAEILSEAGQSALALGVYDSALRESPDNDDLLYGRSLVYERLGKLDLAENDLRKIIAADADDARALNALGYMLVVHTKRLKEAHKLIARARELDPEDAAILDSLGWVQFKLGDKAGARALLMQAYDKLPDAEIAAHLGEVLWVLGEQEQARQIWRKALEVEPDHSVLKDTVQRLSR